MGVSGQRHAPAELPRLTVPYSNNTFLWAEIVITSNNCNWPCYVEHDNSEHNNYVKCNEKLA
jgi:hypothetical protein